jgi:glycosyltransferase involved in cell wall biosynthesis
MLCGVGDYTAALARGLAATGRHEVGVLTDERASGAPEVPGVTVLASVRRWRAPKLWKVFRRLRAWRPDLVHMQFPTTGYAGDLPWILPAAISAARIPLVQTWHEYVLSGGDSWRDVAPAFGRGPIVVVRPAYYERMHPPTRRWCSPQRFVFIPNASAIPKASVDAAERAAIRARWSVGDRRLLVFFGFPYEHKGVDDLIAVADPRRDVVVIAGAIQPYDPYMQSLGERVAREPLRSFVHLTGFLEDMEAARLLAAADAVVLPYRVGGGPWNTSLHAALLQGTFVLATSNERSGYDPRQNLHWARPRDLDEFRAALEKYAGVRKDDKTAEELPPTWETVVSRHEDVYRERLGA